MVNLISRYCLQCKNGRYKALNKQVMVPVSLLLQRPCNKATHPNSWGISFDYYAKRAGIISFLVFCLSWCRSCCILENVTCRADTLQCGTGECVPLTLQCDFNDDCFDGTDELDCGECCSNRSFHGQLIKTWEKEITVKDPFFVFSSPSMKLRQLFQFPGLQTPGRCDFETDLCHWQNMTDDNFDWRRHSGNTPSASTGPMYDHTRGFGGHGRFDYCYLEVLLHWFLKVINNS